MNGLVKLHVWTGTKNVKFPTSAQGYLCGDTTAACGTSCGSSCGAGGENKPKASSCGAIDDK